MGQVQRLTNGTTGGPVFVDVQDGKILRITPMELDDTDAASWTIEARGRKFSPPRRTALSPYSVGQNYPNDCRSPLTSVQWVPGSVTGSKYAFDSVTIANPTPWAAGIEVTHKMEPMHYK